MSRHPNSTKPHRTWHESGTGIFAYLSPRYTDRNSCLYPEQQAGFRWIFPWKWSQSRPHWWKKFVSPRRQLFISSFSPEIVPAWSAKLNFPVDRRTKIWSSERPRSVFRGISSNYPDSGTNSSKASNRTQETWNKPVQNPSPWDKQWSSSTEIWL